MKNLTNYTKQQVIKETQKHFNPTIKDLKKSRATKFTQVTHINNDIAICFKVLSQEVVQPFVYFTSLNQVFKIIEA